MRALKPGGWLWAYDADWTTTRATGAPDIDARWRTLAQEVAPWGPAMGQTHPTWGNQLVAVMDYLGLEQVYATRTEMIRPAQFGEGLRSVMRQRMNRLGKLPADQSSRLDDALTLFDDARLRIHVSAQVSAWGRKPPQS